MPQIERLTFLVHPCYQSAEEKQLAQHGRRRLGERFLTVSGRDIAAPEGCTSRVLAALAQEVMEALRIRGKCARAVHDLRIAVFCRNRAPDIP